jgi:hypothetical protein
MKSKFVFGLLAVMMVLVLAPSSFAQVSITINNPPSPQEVQTNRSAETSDPTSPGAGITVSGALIAQSNLSTTNLILTFPTVITTNSAAMAGGTDIPAGDPIRIVAATGVFSGATLVTRNGGVLTISLIGAADISGNTDSGSFRILGVRIQGNGLTAPATATATLTSSANNFFLNTSTFPIINALGPGIGSLAQGAVAGQTDQTRIQVFTNRNVTDSTASIVVTEGFGAAWRSESQNEIDAPGAAGVVASQVRITVTGIPTDASLNYTTATPTGSALVISAGPSGTLNSSDTSAGTHRATITFGATDMGAVESFQINFTLSPSSTLGTTPTLGDITVTATMAPVGSGTAANALLNSQVPTYTAAEVGPATIGSIIAANTTLLVTYALRQAPFDTGIQIANTTLDPFGASGGGATATAGTITFDFFPPAL